MLYLATKINMSIYNLTLNINVSKVFNDFEFNDINSIITQYFCNNKEKSIDTK